MNPSAFVNTPTASTSTPSASNPNASASTASAPVLASSTSNANGSSLMDVDSNQPTSTSTATTTAPALEAEADADADAEVADDVKEPPITDSSGPVVATGDEPKTARERRQDQNDMELADLLEMMDEWKPIIPDEVTDYFLQKSGFETDDVRVKRLLALAAQRFVSSIAADSFQYARARTAASKTKGRTRTVLTMEDLSAALKDYGVGADRAAYYL